MKCFFTSRTACSPKTIVFLNQKIIFQFTPYKPVRNWATSPQLMHGNLICISPNGKFEDVIWATVAERDETLLNKSLIVMVQLCKENDLKVSDIYDRLDVCGGQVSQKLYFL